MGRLNGLKVSSQWDETDPSIEDEILEAYSELAGEEDLHLNQLEELFHRLQIPGCFTRQLLQLVDQFYAILDSGASINLKDTSHLMVVFMVQNLTITDPKVTSIHECLDIVDIDKLLTRGTKLIKFRDNYRHITDTWRLFGCKENDTLTIPQLQKIKEELNVEVSDQMLIDMVSCGKEFNFEGACVGILTFGEILGKLGELDAR